MNSISDRGRMARLLHTWLPSILLITGVLVVRSTLADHYHVPSGSMEPTLMPGDHVVVNKAAYGLRIPFTHQVLALRNEPRAGEVVIFDSPEDGTRLIKRVVAVGGDRVSLHSGLVRVNGELLNPDETGNVEIYGQRKVSLNLADGGGRNIPEFLVPEGQVLVLGDHRGRSHDGRYFGTVPATALYGRASGVFWRSNQGPLWRPL